MVDVVARAAGVQPAGDVGAEALPELAFDQEEEVLDRAGIGEARHVDLAVDGLERPRDGARIPGADDAGFGKHHQMGTVDRPEAVDEIASWRPRTGA